MLGLSRELNDVFQLYHTLFTTKAADMYKDLTRYVNI